MQASREFEYLYIEENTPPPHLTHTHYTPSLIPYQHPAIIQTSAAHTCVRAEAILWPVTLKRESISISSLEKANWSRGPERRLHSDGPAVLMLRHTRAGRRSTGGVGREAERAHGSSLDWAALLPSQKTSPALPDTALPEETSQTARS